MTDSAVPSAHVVFESQLPPHLRRWVARILRGGVILSSALLILGLIIWGITGVPEEGSGGLGGGSYTLVAGIASLSAASFLVLGLLVLVLTPLVREAMAFLLFLRARDRPFVLLTAFVIVVLMLSVLLGVFGLHL